MTAPDDRAMRVALPRAIWIGAGVLGVLFVAFMATATYLLVSQLQTVRDQERLQVSLIRSQAPLTRDARERLPQTREIARRTERVLRDAAPLASELRRAPLGETLSAAAQLLADPRIPRLAAAAAATLESADRLIRQALQRDTVERLTATTGRVADMQRVLHETLSIQRRTLSLQRELLAIQKEALGHVRNIDRKTVGPPAAR